MAGLSCFCKTFSLRKKHSKKWISNKKEKQKWEVILIPENLRKEAAATAWTGSNHHFEEKEIWEKKDNQSSKLREIGYFMGNILPSTLLDYSLIWQNFLPSPRACFPQWSNVSTMVSCSIPRVFHRGNMNSNQSFDVKHFSYAPSVKLRGAQRCKSLENRISL